MLRRFSSSLSLVTIGIILIAIAFIVLFFLPSQVELNLNLLINSFVNQRGGVNLDSSEIIAFRRIIADRYLLQSVYVFLTGLVLLIAGLLKRSNR